MSFRQMLEALIQWLPSPGSLSEVFEQTISLVKNFIQALTQATLLEAIWYSAGALAVTSTLFMLFLILRRMQYQKRDKKIKERTNWLRQQVFLCLDNIEHCNALENQLKAGDRDLIIEIIRRLMDTLRGDTRNKLIRVLKRFGAISEHVQRLEAGSWGDRALAALDLAWYEKEDVQVALEHALSDTSSRVRITAANSLVTLGIPIDIKQLAKQFTAPGMRKPRALRNFFRRIASIYAEDLTELLNEADDDLLVMVLDALGKSNNYSVVKKIGLFATRHTNKEVRASAIRALTSLGHPAAADAVSKALDDTAWEVRTQAAIAARKIGLGQVKGQLMSLLQDPHWWVRFRAAEALYSLAGVNAEFRARVKQDIEESKNTYDTAMEVIGEKDWEAA